MTILAYFDRDNGRDVELSLPVLYMAARYYGADVQFGFVYDTDKIRRLRPDIVFVPNVIGSDHYIEAAAYAAENGIPVFALLSEGDIRTDGTFDHWGLNKEKTFYQDRVCLWSERTLRYFEQVEPRWSSKYVVTGNPGFDRYKIYRFAERRDFLTPREQMFKRVVGYAAWGFGKLMYPPWRQELLDFYKGDEQALVRMETMRRQVEAMLRSAIESHPDILFILKRHPNEIPPTGLVPEVNEIAALTSYPNVRYEGRDTQIHDVIHVCDLWLSFQSTTAVEAWALGKPTLMLAPDPTYNRIGQKPIYLAQPVAENAQDLNRYLAEMNESGRIRDFETLEKAERRKAIIRDTVGFDDGFNHVRAGVLLGDLIRRTRTAGKPSRHPRFHFRYFLYWVLIVLGRFFYMPALYRHFRKTLKFDWVFRQYPLTNVKDRLARYSKYLDEFHKTHDIPSRLNEPWT